MVIVQNSLTCRNLVKSQKLDGTTSGGTASCPCSVEGEGKLTGPASRYGWLPVGCLSRGHSASLLLYPPGIPGIVVTCTTMTPWRFCPLVCVIFSSCLESYRFGVSAFLLCDPHLTSGLSLILPAWLGQALQLGVPAGWQVMVSEVRLS